MPTIKQKLAFKEVVKGSTISGAMKEAGYSDSTSKRTNKLTNSDGWQDLMDTYLPDKDLARVHKEGLEAGKTIYKNNNATHEVEEVGYEADYAVRHKYLDTAYKLKGVYAPEKKELSGELNTTHLTQKQIDQINQIALDDQ